MAGAMCGSVGMPSTLQAASPTCVLCCALWPCAQTEKPHQALAVSDQVVKLTSVRRRGMGLGAGRPRCVLMRALPVQGPVAVPSSC